MACYKDFSELLNVLERHLAFFDRLFSRLTLGVVRVQD